MPGVHLRRAREAGGSLRPRAHRARRAHGRARSAGLHDSIDFPTAFLGCIKAGVVPVCVNTLLTATDYDYMLRDSRARALVVSAPLLPTFAPLVARLPTLAACDRVRCGGGRPSPFAELLSGSGPALRRRRRPPRRCLLLALLVGLHRRAQGHGARAFEPDPDRGAVRAPDPRIARGRPRVLRGQAVLRLRTGQQPDVPDGGGRHRDPDGRASDARRRVRAAARGTSRRSSTACPRSMPRCSPSRSAARATNCACVAAPRPARRLPEELGKRWAAHFGVDILDGIGSTEMLHIFLSNRAGRRALRHHRQAGAGL